MRENWDEALEDLIDSQADSWCAVHDIHVASVQFMCEVASILGDSDLKDPDCFEQIGRKTARLFGDRFENLIPLLDSVASFEGELVEPDISR